MKWIKLLVREPKGKVPFGRPRRRWEDDIRTELKDVGWECVD
jgi:hypothetical protein